MTKATPFAKARIGRGQLTSRFDCVPLFAQRLTPTNRVRQPGRRFATERFSSSGQAGSINCVSDQSCKATRPNRGVAGAVDVVSGVRGVKLSAAGKRARRLQSGDSKRVEPRSLDNAR
jgi:hypothetical protein